MNKLYTSLMAVMIALLTLSPAMAGKKKKGKDKGKKGKVDRAKVSTRHNQTVERGSGELIHNISVGTSGGSGQLFVIYKLPGGSRYTCKSQSVGGGGKAGGKKKKGKKGKDSAKKSEMKSYSFPHTDGAGKYVGYAVAIEQNGKIVSRYASNPIWLRCLDKLVDGAPATFNSSGGPADEEGEGYQKPNDDQIAQAIRMRRYLEIQRRNKRLMEKVNGKKAQ